MPLSPKTYTFLCGCFAALGSILFGYDLGIIASVLPAPNFLRVTGNPNETYLGFITSCLLLGAFCGCIPAALITDRFSRRSAIFIGAIVFMFGGAMQTGCRNREMMLAGRFFAGFGIGMLSFLAPLYQSEIAAPSIRGRLTTLQQFFLGIGAFIASFVGYGCTKNYLGTAFQWRFPLGLQIFPAVPLAALIFLFPESPRWLMLVGREEESLQSLARLHASGDVTDPFVVNEFAEIKAKVTEERLTDSGWSQLLVPTNARRVFLGFSLQFSVQMTGVSVIQYYAPQIFASMGFTTERTLLFQSINSVLALIGEALCVAFVDRLGRRWPLIVCNGISSATFAVGTALQAQFPAATNNNVHASIAFVMMTWIFNVAFSAGIGPISWAWPVEALSTSTRAKGSAITSMGAWLANFFVSQVSPVAFANIGWRYYLVYAIGGATNAIFIWLFLPETKGLVLEEMDEMFAQTGILVPFSSYRSDRVSGKAREEQIRQGIHHITGVDVHQRIEDPMGRIESSEKAEKAEVGMDEKM